jgi:hypothetical protein
MNKSRILIMIGAVALILVALFTFQDLRTKGSASSNNFKGSVGMGDLQRFEAGQQSIGMGDLQRFEAGQQNKVASLKSSAAISRNGMGDLRSYEAQQDNRLASLSGVTSHPGMGDLRRYEAQQANEK